MKSVAKECFQMKKKLTSTVPLIPCSLMVMRLKVMLLNKSGQAMIEYVIVTVVIGLSLIGVTALFRPALVSYLQRIYMIVSLPIP